MRNGLITLKINIRENTDKYHLPSEAQWEYAARAGSETLFSFGNNIEDLNKYGWFDAGLVSFSFFIGEL